MECRPTRIDRHHIIHGNVGLEGGQIDGVIVADLKPWPDDRGHFAEIFRHDQPLLEGFVIRQSSVTMTRPGAIKAFHHHERQSDIFVPLVGEIRIALVDFRIASPTCGWANSIFCGARYLKAVRIPKGIAHGYEVLGQDEMTMVYYTDQHYDPSDEHRYAHDDPAIGWTWWGIEHR